MFKEKLVGTCHKMVHNGMQSHELTNKATINTPCQNHALKPQFKMWYVHEITLGMSRGY